MEMKDTEGNIVEFEPFSTESQEGTIEAGESKNITIKFCPKEV